MLRNQLISGLIILLWLTLALAGVTTSSVISTTSNPAFTWPYPRPALSLPLLPRQTQALTPTTLLTAPAWPVEPYLSDIRALLTTGEAIWAATGGGVLRWERAGTAYQFYTMDDGLASNEVTAIAVDEGGQLWFGTANGVSKFDGQSWQSYTVMDGLADNYVRAIAIDRSDREGAGQVWVATAPEAGLGGGVSLFNGESWSSYTTAAGLVSDRVVSLAIDPAGRKWFGTDAGVSRFDDRNWTTYTSAEGLAHNWVKTIAVDPAGQLWFGTAGGGVSRFDGTNWVTYTAAAGLASNVIYTLAAAEDGRIWAGTSGGLSRFDGTGWASYTRREGLPYERVRAMAMEGAGPKWLAFDQSGAGVIAFDNRRQAASPAALAGLVAVPAATLPPSAVVQITGRRLIDGQAGRLYARGTVDGIEKTLVLAYADERLLASHDLGGELALDSDRHRLYIDQGPAGLAVIDTQTERLVKTIFLPDADYAAPPQVDPVNGAALAFRDNVVYSIDPETGTIMDTLTSAFTTYINCASGPILTVPTISGTRYDPARRLLYTASITSICTSSASGGLGYGVEAYRLDSGARLAEGDPDWAWFLARDWAEEAGPIEFDPKRQRFYQVTGGGLRVFETKTMALSLLLPQPVEGKFERYDPITDQLQFRLNGQLAAFPAEAIQPPSPEIPTAEPLPQTPVTFLAASPGWAEDKSLFGLWVDPAQAADCQAGYLNWGEGLLFLSQDGGQSWGRARGGLRGGCELMTRLAVSPDYARDQTLFAGVWELGLFKSTDGGQLWQPAGVGLPGPEVGQILLSPAFGRDQTAFVQAGYQDYYRSLDGGRTWRELKVSLEQSQSLLSLALSPDFAVERPLAGTVHNNSLGRSELVFSHDGGEHWEKRGILPEGAFPQTLSLAPQFAGRQTLFVYGMNNEDRTQNALYRSTDGGYQWELLFSFEPSPGPHSTGSGQAYATAQAAISLLYAPDLAGNRLLFLLAGEALYESRDEGQSWRPLELAGEARPTALAVSPDFGRDRSLFVGTADGQLLTLQIAE